MPNLTEGQGRAKKQKGKRDRNTKKQYEKTMRKTRNTFFLKRKGTTPAASAWNITVNTDGLKPQANVWEKHDWVNECVCVCTWTCKTYAGVAWIVLSHGCREPPPPIKHPFKHWLVRMCHGRKICWLTCEPTSQNWRKLFDWSRASSITFALARRHTRKWTTGRLQTYCCALIGTILLSSFTCDFTEFSRTNSCRCQSAAISSSEQGGQASRIRLCVTDCSFTVSANSLKACCVHGWVCVPVHICAGETTCVPT